MSRRYKVRIRQVFEGFAVVSAESRSDASEKVEDLVNEGDIDVVDMRGMCRGGNAEIDCQCIGVTTDPVTVRKGR